MSSSVCLRHMATALLYMNIMKGSSSYKGREKIVCTGDSLKSVLLTCTALSGVIKKTSPLLLEYVCVISSACSLLLCFMAF